MPKGSRTAFAKADVADAKRGAPATDLASFATRRGLESMGSGVIVGSFTAIQPYWPEYVFNVCRGVLDNGRFGLVEHELYEIPLRPDGDLGMGGAFYGTATRNRFSVGRLVGLEKAPKDEPFANDSAWVPSTGVVLRVPEAALLPRVRIRRKQNTGRGNPELSDDGAPGFSMVGSQFIDDALRSALVRGAVAQTLTSLAQAFVEVELYRGAMALRVNGFLSDDAELDGLTAAASQLAEAWAELGARDASGADLGSELPAPDPEHRPPGWESARDEWLPKYEQAGEELSLTPEEPVALHRAAPRIPVPGTAEAVLRGQFGGSTTVGRLLWTGQGGRTSSSARGAAWFPARKKAETAVGGIMHEPTDMYAEVVDGSAWCWSRLRSFDGLEARALADRAVQTMTDLGLADV